MARAGYDREIDHTPRGPRPQFPIDDPDVTWGDALQRIADTIPDRIAVDDGSSRTTYAELVRRANQAAHALLDAEADDDADRPVAVVARQGLGAVVAILAPLHAQRISAPLDAAEPTERLRHLLAASTAKTVLTEARHYETVRLATGEGQHIVVLEDTTRFPSTPPEVPHAPDPGFVVFTSGSTGTPKGVHLTHPHIVRDTIAMYDVASFPLDARAPLFTSFGFSAAVGQVTATLFVGATICPLDLAAKSARRLAEWVQAEGTTSLSLVPSLLRALTELEPPVEMPSVEMVMLSGEPTTGSDIRRARAVLGDDTRFVNSFGCTESYIVSVHIVGPGDDPGDGPLPVGRPIPRVQVTVVDVDTDQPVPDGQAGRLVVVGDMIAAGYWQDSALTAEKFFVAPDGRRGFRTSDLVRIRGDGVLEHLGRLDARVKVRGAMVSVNEVERALCEIDGVAEAVVTGAPVIDRGTRLVAYVVPDGTVDVHASTLRRELAMLVPTTMLPGAFVVVDALPHTVRGKVDRAALPPLPAPPEYREATGKERELAELFAAVLGVERVGLDDDFFEIGGDSLGAVELIAGISERFGVDVPTTTVLDAPTVAELAPRLDRRRTRRSSVLVPVRDDLAGVPLFCVAGGGSPALTLRAFADALGSRRVFGIQARGLEERAIPDWSVEAVARRAVRAMRRAQPAGPYALAGYSFGALVAFEIACRLEAEGEDVGTLVVLDGLAPRRRRARRQQVRRRARQLMLARTGLLPSPGLRQYERFLELSVLMAGNYAPHRLYGGSVLLVRTRLDVPDDAHGRFVHRDLGWSGVVAGPVTVVDVPGDHLGLLRAPVVTEVAAAVRGTLA